MKQKVIRINEDKIREVVTESLKNILGSMFGRSNSSEYSIQGKELAEKVITEFSKLCKECGLEIRFTMSDYFWAVSNKSRPNGIDGDLDKFTKLVRVNWIRKYVSFTKSEEGDIACGVQYCLNFDDCGYLSDKYSEQRDIDLQSMSREDFLSRYQI